MNTTPPLTPPHAMGREKKKATRWKIGQVPPPAPDHNPPLHTVIGKDELTIIIQYAHAEIIFELKPYGVVSRWQWVERVGTGVKIVRGVGAVEIPGEAWIYTSTPCRRWGPEAWQGLLAEARNHPTFWLNKEKLKREALAKEKALAHLPVAV